ncbi:hypothetical protein LEP1GSC188_2303 [Leptospira weilii serovar Topaz str. LT2116]|uniref:Uncharacterized protein n=4 Tax=Leptospira weilii TaxID=28184 RepID=M3GYY3_9LEPT|nr:hypothetical protein [Leptospira weilii]EMF81700.1 hypothetical protein LEP1GSC188_2303 [Leptospira weilii serovar Topaz str. LT2116]EMM71852.1 hypothetical protein LEP1GSC038_3980 [Leptospira weilii str. 2006001855]EMY15345.1 hypothetical protein LEP1GSC043_1556 [Leptospira weilii str. Ecochallenge]EMN87847.1 hypothetical protein LEP1GSC108_1120 [Leptospira weilii str. UI 13098]MCL8268421.1 hypothetical protein [Leptospira weilii]
MFRYPFILFGCISVFFCCYAVYIRIPIEFKIVPCWNELEPSFSLPVFLPGLLLETFGYSWIFVPLNYSVLFLVSIFPILRKRNLSEESSIPKHTLVFAALILILSAFYFITFWKTGVVNRSDSYMNHVFFSYVFGWILIFSIYIYNRKRKTLISNYFFHLLLFVWFLWGAFPWFWGSI